MKKNLLTLCLTFFLLMACTGNNAADTPAQTPLPDSTETSLPTSTPTPTNTPRPPVEVEYYRLRLEYTSISDWASLEFPNPEAVLALFQVNLSCSGQECSPETVVNVSAQQIDLFRPLAILSAEPSVTLTVEMAISTDLPTDPFEIVSKHGAIGGSGVRISYLVGEEWILLQELNHYWVNQSNPDTSALSFQVDLSPLQSSADISTKTLGGRPEKLVLAFYYPWFPDYGWYNDTPMSDQPAIFINSLDAEDVAWQIDQAKSAGIDGFIMSYNSDWSDDRAQVLLAVAEEKGFKISFLLETLNSGGPAWPPQTLEQWIGRADTVFADSPAFLRVDGKPVMFIYSSGALPLETWQESFTRLEEEGVDFFYIGMGYDLSNLAVFDGIFDYAVQSYSDLYDLYQNTSRSVRNYQLLAPIGTGTSPLWVATISPGFDSTPYKLAIPHDFTVPRGAGEYYLQTMEAALDSNPDWVVITSWNEYGENTHIEPSLRDGSTFLDMTRAFVEEWKDGSTHP